MRFLAAKSIPHLGVQEAKRRVVIARDNHVEEGAYLRSRESVARRDLTRKPLPQPAP